MIFNEDELEYKLEEVIRYLKEHGGYEYKVYNHLCPKDNNEPDSNIVEYAEDVKWICDNMIRLIIEQRI